MSSVLTMATFNIMQFTSTNAPLLYKYNYYYIIYKINILTNAIECSN